MKKIYDKNEVTHAIIWIVIYVVVTSILDDISINSIGIAKSLTVIFHIILSIYLFAWIKKNGIMEKCGLVKPIYPASVFLFYIPMLIIATMKIWFGVTMKYSPLETVFYAVSMICVGFLEEIIFRSFLYKGMEKDNVKSAIIVSSITFGIGHIVNLFNASGQDFIQTIFQVIFAIAMGFMITIMFYKGKSLWPCIIFHSLNNSLSAISDDDAVIRTFGGGMTGFVVWVGIIVVIATVYSIYMMKKLPKADA